mmetsp:Transcript_1865/g.2867  ORF Transcript_1865/g.2867 Transcript_1865/m.2867 type:complete len:231 (+) Transcript_1865:53-745(+)
MARLEYLAAAIFCLLLTAAPLARGSGDADDEYEDTERALLVVHKTVVDKGTHKLAYPLVVQGWNVSISIVVHNAGAGPASSITLTDVLPANARLAEGSLTQSWPKLSSGSRVLLNYTLVFTSGGRMDLTSLPQASVAYKAAENEAQVGLSSRPGVYMLSPTQELTRKALIVGQYASLGICRTPEQWRNMAAVCAILGTLLGVNQAVKSFGVRTTNTKRKRALRELEDKDE